MIYCIVSSREFWFLICQNPGDLVRAWLVATNQRSSILSAAEMSLKKFHMTALFFLFGFFAQNSKVRQCSVGCPILAKSCQIILPKKYIVRNVIIKQCTDFQLFLKPSWSPAMSHKVCPDPFISRKKICSDYRLRGTERPANCHSFNAWISVEKDMPQVPRH